MNYFPLSYYTLGVHDGFIYKKKHQDFDFYERICENFKKLFFPNTENTEKISGVII